MIKATKKYRVYQIKTINDIDELKELITKAFYNKFIPELIIPETEEESFERIISEMSETLKYMEEYHSKKCTEFEKKHIINFMNKANGSYINAKYFKELFKRFNLKY